MSRGEGTPLAEAMIEETYREQGERDLVTIRVENRQGEMSTFLSLSTCFNDIVAVSKSCFEIPLKVRAGGRGGADF